MCPNEPMYYSVEAIVNHCGEKAKLLVTLDLYNKLLEIKIMPQNILKTRIKSLYKKVSLRFCSQEILDKVIADYKALLSKIQETRNIDMHNLKSLLSYDDLCKKELKKELITMGQEINNIMNFLSKLEKELREEL